MKLSTIPIALLSAGLLVTVAGCSSSSTTGSDAGSGSATSGNITYQYFNNQPAAISATKEIVADFEKKYPKIKVKLEVAPADSLQQKLTTQYAGGIAPDVIQNDSPSDTLQFAQFLQPLDDVLSKNSISDIPNAVLSGLKADGKVLAVPTESQSYMVFANKTLLDKVGVTIPSGESMSWDEFESIAKATTTDGVSGLAWGLQSPTSNFASFGIGFGAKYFSSPNQDSAKAEIGSKELQVPERVRAMIEKGYIDKTTVTQSSSDALPTFYAGKAAMTVAGSYQISNIESAAPKGFDWIALPPLAGSKGPQQMSAPITLSITKKSSNVKAAATFVNYYMQADNLAKINIADGQIPPTTTALAALEKQTSGETGWKEVLQSGKTLVTPQWNTFTKYEDWKTTVATPAYQKYLAGSITSSQLANELESGWTSTKQ